MPPIHPALVHFPIALFTFAFVLDFIGFVRNSLTLRTAAFWSLLGALLGIALTIAAGYYDMSRAALGETHDYVAFHTAAGWMLAVAMAGLTLWRWILRRSERAFGPGYLVAGFIVLALTLFQGWYGGEMVYSQGAGVAAAGKGTEAAQAGEKRLQAMTIIDVGHEHEEHLTDAK